MQNNNLRNFFIKLFAIVVAVILIINTSYNLILADKMDKFFYIFSLKENKNQIKDKLRNEIKKGIAKDKILDEKDKILIQDLYKKIKDELSNNK